MAKKKPRTPTPPRGRPVQAPRRRDDTKRGAGFDFGLGHRNALYAIAGAGIVALIVVVLIVALGGGGKTDDKKVAAAMTAAGCSFKTVKAFVPKGQGTHVNSLTAKLPWNTTPPSNGQHYPEWAVWGFYTADPVNPRRVVHNEEHGGVVYWWGSDVPQSTVDALQSLYNDQPDGTFGTKYPALGSKVAITAWTGDPNRYQRDNYYGFGHVAVCPTWNDKVASAFATFRDVYRGHGPEGIPLSEDEPGDGPQTQ